MALAVSSGGDAPKNVDELIATRRHPVYKERHKCLYYNQLAYHGGRPYIDERLTRFPAESSIAWDGSVANNRESRFGYRDITVTGRKQRAYVVNNAARIVEKIRQYVFQQQPVREGADESFLRDANRCGQGINAVMGELCNYVTMHGWAWLGVDAPRMLDAEGNPMRPTLAQQRSQKLHVYMNAYSALQVPDWYIDESGEVKWLITEGTFIDNSDPRRCAITRKMRRLYEPGLCVEVLYDVDPALGNEPTNITMQEYRIPFAGVPFVLCGTPSPFPWWFDDVEAINRAIMDLESANDEAFFQAVYPQLIIPQSMVDSLIAQTENGEDMARKVESIIGLSSAIAERPEDSGITRYVMPPPFASQIAGKEIERKREMLFDTVGLALKVQSRQVESAEAKAWNNLDAQAVLAVRSQQLQEAEEKAVVICKAWDKSFKEYKPVYATTFDIRNINEEIQALVSIAPLDMPDELRKVHLRALSNSIVRLANLNLTEQEQKALNDSVEKMDFTEPIPAAPVVQRMVDDEEEDEGSMNEQA